jgi:hypothetical protein
MNKSPIILILMFGLVVSVGCAKPDWIQQTLVTVDVTGMWRSSDGNLELKLEQQGAKVTGSMDYISADAAVGPVSRFSGTIEGSVGGDRFRFKQTSGRDIRYEGEMTVAGDEMIGSARSVLGSRGEVRLRRLDSSAPPRSP